jgi:hypothetical protein
MSSGKYIRKPRDPSQSKNVTIDAELVQTLNEAADGLQGKFGFRPTLSQTIHYLIKRLKQEQADAEA